MVKRIFGDLKNCFRALLDLRGVFLWKECKFKGNLEFEFVILEIYIFVHVNLPRDFLERKGGVLHSTLEVFVFSFCSIYFCSLKQKSSNFICSITFLSMKIDGNGSL